MTLKYKFRVKTNGAVELTIPFASAWMAASWDSSDCNSARREDEDNDDDCDEEGDDENEDGNGDAGRKSMDAWALPRTVPPTDLNWA